MSSGENEVQVLMRKIFFASDLRTLHYLLFYYNLTISSVFEVICITYASEMENPTQKHKFSCRYFS